jgi:hypothetical protein
LAALGFKKNLPLPSGSGSRTEPEAKPQEPLFSDLNDISASPTSYHNMQDDIPHPEARHSAQHDLPSPEARSDSLYPMIHYLCTIFRLMMSPPPMQSADPSRLVDSETVDDFLAQILPRP